MLATANNFNGLQIAADADAPGFRVRTVSFPNTEIGPTPPTVPAYSSELTDRVPDSTMIYLGGNELGQMLAPVVAIAIAALSASDMTTGVSDLPSDAGPAAGSTPDAVDGPTTDATATTTDDVTAVTEIVGGFLTLLTGEYVVAIDAPQATSLADPNSLYILVASGVEGGALVDSLLGLVSDSLGTDGSDLSVTTETVDGSTIYTASIGNGPGAITFSYGIVAGPVAHWPRRFGPVVPRRPGDVVVR